MADKNNDIEVYEIVKRMECARLRRLADLFTAESEVSGND